MSNEFTNVVIVGQGAIGLLWYHHLSTVNQQQNKKITLLASNQEELTSQHITSATYQFTGYQKQSSQALPLNYSQPTDIETANVIIFCVKSYQVTKAIEALLSKISEQSVIILAHNGMGTFEEVAKVLPSSQVIMAMLTTHGCLRSASLRIVHTGLGQTDIGQLSGKLSLPEQTLLTERLNSALPQVSFHQCIAEKQWLKLAINCVINPITAINNIDNGEVNNEQFYQLIHGLLIEVSLVAKAEGINLDVNELTEKVYNVAKATEKNISSMRCDILANKPSEIDFINGYIHDLGEKHNIATPLNTQLWQQIKALENNAK